MLTQGLGYATVTAEAKYLISFTKSRKRFVLSLHYNGSNSLLIVSATNIYIYIYIYIYIKLEIDSKIKDSEIKPYTLRLGNTSKDTTNVNMKKAGRKEKNNFFFF